MLGVEPWGRILTGILELIAGISLLLPWTALWGAILAALIMIGAISSHLFVIGFSGDNEPLHTRGRRSRAQFCSHHHQTKTTTVQVIGGRFQRTSQRRGHVEEIE